MTLLSKLITNSMNHEDLMWKAFNSTEKQNRAIANQFVNKTTQAKAIQLADDGQDFMIDSEPLQGKFIIQRKPGQDDELPLQRMSINSSQSDALQAFQPTLQRKGNNTGMPDKLKSGLESMSGFDLGDVKVHYNSPKPAQLKAFAYAHGNDIHIGPGHEKYLPHEGWHVVQQRQGRVQPAMQKKSEVRTNDAPAIDNYAIFAAKVQNIILKRLGKDGIEIGDYGIHPAKEETWNNGFSAGCKKPEKLIKDLTSNPKFGIAKPDEGFDSAFREISDSGMLHIHINIKDKKCNIHLDTHSIVSGKDKKTNEFNSKWWRPDQLLGHLFVDLWRWSEPDIFSLPE